MTHRSNIGPLCFSCHDTHIFEGVAYIDCPWCSCLDYTNPEAQRPTIFFRSGRVRGARRREWRSKLGSYREMA